MELKKGMYVKTILNSIYKIIAIVPDREFPYVFKIDDEYCEVYGLKEHQIKKASYNIIDLIEVGDYVNGVKMVEHNGKLGFYDTDLDEEYFYPLNELVINTVVTKEQFQAMEYRLED